MAEGDQRTAEHHTAGATPYFNPLSVQLPEKFDFREPQAWNNWFRRWQRYRNITEMNLRSEEMQINTLLYAMGRESEDVLAALKLTDEQSKSYDAIAAAFEKHFVPRTNVIYERAKFNQRRQEAHETVENFVADLHRMAERCQFGTLREEMIRDRLVVGLSDRLLSEKLQLNPDLTLDIAVTTARNTEAIKQQQKDLRSLENENVDEVRTSTTGSRHRKGRTPAQNHKPCKWCGKLQGHARTMCPASKTQCRNCGKMGHFASVCMSRRRQKSPDGNRRRIATVEEVYLGQIKLGTGTEPWTVTTTVDGTEVTFKIDTGADVSVLPWHLYDSTRMAEIRPTSKVLLGPGETRINTLGQASMTMKWQEHTTEQDVFVVKGLREPLLGRPAIRALHILQYLHEISTAPRT